MALSVTVSRMLTPPSRKLCSTLQEVIKGLFDNGVSDSSMYIVSLLFCSIASGESDAEQPSLCILCHFVYSSWGSRPKPIMEEQRCRSWEPSWPSKVGGRLCDPDSSLDGPSKYGLTLLNHPPFLPLSPSRSLPYRTRQSRPLGLGLLRRSQHPRQLRFQIVR